MFDVAESDLGDHQRDVLVLGVFSAVVFGAAAHRQAQRFRKTTKCHPVRAFHLQKKMK